MKKAGRKILHIITGFTLVVVGFLGLILPILNGTILLIIGLIILSFESPTLKRKLSSLAHKNQMINRLYLKLEKVLHKFFGVQERKQ